MDVKRHFAKRQEISHAEVMKERARAAGDILRFCREVVGGLTIAEFVDQAGDLADRVACWFPDECYVAFRDYIALYVNNPSAKGENWQDAVEPVLNEIVSALRPDNKSEILNLPGDRFKDYPEEYRFLPNLKK